MSRGRDQSLVDAGFTLIELLMVMLLLGVVGGVVSTAMISTLQTSRNVGVRGDDLNSVQVAVEEMTKLLRTAAQPPGAAPVPAAIVAGSGSDLTFYGYNRPGYAPSQIHFWVDATQQLNEEIDSTNQCVAPYTYTVARARVLAHNVSSTTSLFTYLSAPVPAPSPTSLTGAALPATLPTASLGAVEEIQINLSVDLPSSPDIPSAQVRTLVFLPNHQVRTVNIPGAAC